MSIVVAVMQTLAQQSKCKCKRRTAAAEIIERIAQHLEDRSYVLAGGGAEHEAAARLIRAELKEGRDPK